MLPNVIPNTQPEIDSFDRRCLVLKIEVDEGVDPSGTPAMNAFDLLDGKSATAFDVIERKRDRPYFTHHKFKVANKRVTVDGGFELAPPLQPGTDAVAVREMLLVGGMAQTLDDELRVTRYSPVSSNFASAHAYWWHAGTYIRIRGCRAKITGLAMEIDKVFQAQASLEGAYDEVEESDLPSDADYSAYREPTICTPENTQMRITALPSGSPVHVWGKSLSVDFGTEMGQSRFTGNRRRTKIRGRMGTWKATFARPARSDLDIHALRDAEQEVLIDFTLYEFIDGVLVASQLWARGQIEQINLVDKDKEAIYEVSGRCIASDAGGDEFGIDFSDETFRVDEQAEAQWYANVSGFSLQLTVSGVYAAPVTYAVSSGTLPPGLSLNASTGLISGTPTDVGASSVTFTATDSDGAVSAAQAIAFNILT